MSRASIINREVVLFSEGPLSEITHQLLQATLTTPSPTLHTPTPHTHPHTLACVGHTNISRPSWVNLDPQTNEIIMPDLLSSSDAELADLREAVKKEGTLACYVAMSLTDIGTE